MLRALRNLARASSSTAPRRGLRFSPFQRFQSRGYAKATDYKDRMLPRQYSEDDESLHSRSWTTYVIPTVLLAISGAVMYIHHNDEKRAILKGSEQSTGSERSNSNRPMIGGPFKLFDTENHLVTESDLRGNWTLMYFGYTSSPDVGPDEVQKMAKVINILVSEHNLKIRPIFITIDPQRDSTAQLRAYLKEFDPRIIGLTGPIPAIRQIAQEYRVYFKKVEEEGQDYMVECSHNMYLLDPNMDIVKCFGVEYDAWQLSDGIMKEVKKASK